MLPKELHYEVFTPMVLQQYTVHRSRPANPFFLLCLININLTDSDSLKKELQFVNNTNLKQRHLNLIRTPIQDVNLPYKLLSVFIVVF